MSISTGASNRRGNPIARNPGAFDVNVIPDTRTLRDNQRSRMHTRDQPKFHRSADPESYNIMPGEILMAKTKNGSRYRGRALHCFSSANGLGSSTDGDHAILKDLQFGGIAVTGYDLRNDQSREQQGFVSSFGGLNTIMNTGSQNIFPGDLLRVTLPDVGRWDKKGSDLSGSGFRAPEGVPRDKLSFAVEPTRCSISRVKDVFETGTPKDIQDLGGEELVKIYDELKGTRKEKAAQIQLCMKFCYNQRRFEIGRALSYAKPGHALDVCLG